jgi:hypothetical protein
MELSSNFSATRHSLPGHVRAAHSWLASSTTWWWCSPPRPRNQYWGIISWLSMPVLIRGLSFFPCHLRTSPQDATETQNMPPKGLILGFYPSSYNKQLQLLVTAAGYISWTMIYPLWLVDSPANGGTPSYQIPKRGGEVWRVFVIFSYKYAYMLLMLTFVHVYIHTC